MLFATAAVPEIILRYNLSSEDFLLSTIVFQRDTLYDQILSFDGPI